MAENTKIEWAHHTFNPWIGCTKVGPGCDNCYAEADFDKRRHVVQWGAGNPRKRTAPSTWAQPLKWNKEAERLGVRYRVFCASLADVFDNAVPTEWLVDLLELIRTTPRLDWLMLTKRIGVAVSRLQQAHAYVLEHWTAIDAQPLSWWLQEWIEEGNPPNNVWIGATIVNQEEADRDIPKLLAVPAAKRFLSMEPLLGPVELRLVTKTWAPGRCNHCCNGDRCDDPSHYDRAYCPHCHGTGGQPIKWVIAGGESGPGARPMHPDWARSLRDQCQAAGVPFLFKQWGQWKPINQMDEAEHEPLYVPNVKAKPHEDQGNLDDIFGRRCTVDTTVVHHDGTTRSITEPMAFLQGTEAMMAFRVGKKAAGRLLDGREWNEVPT